MTSSTMRKNVQLHLVQLIWKTDGKAQENKYEMTLKLLLKTYPIKNTRFFKFTWQHNTNFLKKAISMK